MPGLDTELAIPALGLLLRPPRPYDAASLFEAVAASMHEVSRWLPWCHGDYSLDDARAFVERGAANSAQGSEFPLVIVAAGDGTLLGGSGINQLVPDTRRGNLGYWVRTSAQGRGVATAVARRVAEFGACELGLQRIEIVAAVGNVASQRVAQKAGATREGVLRNRIRIRDVQHDAVMFSFVPADFATPG